MKEEINIQAPKISKYEEQLNDPSVTFYQSGGARFNGMIVAFTKIQNRALTPEEIKAKHENEKDLIGQSY